jgi:hypothetical protein
MITALYYTEDELPFGDKSRNPYTLYNPLSIKKWNFVGNSVSIPAEEYFLMPVFHGLCLLKVPGIMAHVSLALNFQRREVNAPKRIWVEITTEAKESDALGLPVVISDGVLQVELIWKQDKNTFNPFDLIQEHQAIEAVKAPNFWSDFFLKKLCEKKAIAYEKAKKALAEAELFRCIPDID